MFEPFTNDTFEAGQSFHMQKNFMGSNTAQIGAGNVILKVFYMCDIGIIVTFIYGSYAMP